MLDGIYLRPIARIRTDYAQKFGIPRQSGLVDQAQGTIVFEPEFAQAKVVQGLDEFTHLWLLWHFQNGEAGGSAQDVQADYAATLARDAAAPESADASESSSVDSDEAARIVEESLHRRWSATVRPPRLGGSERKGVFATRSPFRPNPVGLSCVRIDRVEITPAGPLIHVLGADLRDGTPIFDIKPYLPLADCWPEASGGFTEHIDAGLLAVEIADDLLQRIPQQKRAALLQVLENDPRPVAVTDPERVFTWAYAGIEVQFTVSDDVAYVVDNQEL